VIVLAGVAAFAQTAPAFDVATIKMSPPEEQGALIALPSPGRMNVTNSTLKMLIGQAYGPELGQGFQVIGGPSWIDTARYVVVGQAAPTTTPAELNAMLRTLLADRFALKTHTVKKEVDAYALLMARRDGKLGERLQMWDGNCNGRPAPRRNRTARAHAARHSSDRRAW
jgi:uncharacterized protein (TIGR03435 family)